MPSCAVLGCDIKSGYRLPKDEARCIQWLTAINNPIYPVNMPKNNYDKVRVCSKHFKSEDVQRDFCAELLGTKPKNVLLECAVPSVFPWTSGWKRSSSGESESSPGKREHENMGDMETFDESETAVSMEMVLPMDMVSEEVVTQDEGGADSDGLTAAMDSLTSLPSVSILSKFGKEFRYLEDSSEDEHDPDPNPNPAAGRPYVSGQNSAEEGSGSDVWTGSARDDCLCWECGERFHSLERLMVHFRKHEACVRCNMCHVTFRRVVSLSMHLDNVHNNVDLYCAPCSRLFHSKWDLNEHLGKHSEPGSEPEPCAEPQEEIEVHLVTSDTEGEPMPKPVSHQGSPLGDSTLPELVARDHTYNNSCKADNGAAAGTYTLRHTHRLTKALPESAHQEKEARVAGGGRDRHVEDFAVGKAVKLDASPLTPPLLRSLASSEQDGKMEQGGMDPCSGEVPWDGEPIEEDDLEHSGEEVNSDGFMSPGDSSEYDPGTASDASSESISSGNSSGSSYTPNKRGGKKVKTRRCLAIKRPCKAESSQVAIAPARQPVVSDSVNFGQTIRHQQKPQPNIQAPAKQNVTDTSAPGHNKALARPVFGPSRMYACDLCREVFPEQVSYRRHHCPVKAAIMSWRGPASIPAPAIQNPTAAPIPAPGALRTIAVPSASSLVSTPGQVLNSGSGVLKVAQTGVPCTIQNPTLVSSLPVASGPVFTLPSIMLPSPSPSVQSGSRPIMATVVFNGNAPNPGPLKILGMFANRSQEVALGKRLEKSWRSKGVFLCRQCGAISRQPSLGVRHRYLHRGSRRHRCHCGRTFLHLLHLLRHHVQHAEATRFVCAPCGRTFSGARCLARHKQDQEGKRKRMRKRKKRERSRKDCHAPFSCDCGQIFHRPTAFLWHKLKNPKQQGASLKGTQGNYPADDTASQIETCPL
ncbi:hypothetical protein COCON_G00003220 [Conger conger]|uniref:Uncharacterized protein n=1 Tax=Conger conger TaxID=82655 RepID=A0A9Q1E128_CONCO|nr:hypothetical protein COCON_G00003220 [Conger conger]